MGASNRPQCPESKLANENASVGEPWAGVETPAVDRERREGPSGSCAPIDQLSDSGTAKRASCIPYSLRPLRRELRCDILAEEAGAVTPGTRLRRRRLPTSRGAFCLTHRGEAAPPALAGE